MDPFVEEMESFQKEDLGDRPTDWDGLYGYKPIGGLRARHLYNMDLEDSNQRQRGRRRHFSKQELLSGDWLYIVDNDLPLTLFKTTNLWERLDQVPATTKLCHNCCSFRLLSRPPRRDVKKVTVDLGKLRRVVDSCDLCRFFLRCLDRQKVVGDETVEILRDCSALKLDTHSLPFLQILGDPGKKALLPARTQRGLPVLPSPGSQGHFDILRGWLDACNGHHKRYGCYLKAPSVLPTRVIDVGDAADSASVRLYCSQKDEQENYVALSHCWGNVLYEQIVTFCTFLENIHDRVQGIEISSLPQTFQDTIRVTQELGQRYLWIDSLCIIQDDPEDWAREANTMERVYSMAYFTIAAISAQSATQGILNPRRQREFVKIEKPPPPPPSSRRRELFEDFEWPIPKYKVYTNTGTGIWRELNDDLAPPEVEQYPLYICEPIDDFTGDVEESILSLRGWVFQKRALSRRILHFAATQTYWECGVGVHCETLTLMYNADSYILGNPCFPSTTSQRTGGQNIIFLESLFNDYMQREFTQPADRAFALAGLETRLAEAFYTDVHYGIVGKFLHRNLLWLRRRETVLTRTYLHPDDSHKELAPSWSWMGFEGSIDFVSVGFETVTWSEAVRFHNRRELRCRVREFHDYRLERRGDEFVLLDVGSGDEESAEERDSIDCSSPPSWLRFDAETWGVEYLKCVVVGRQTGYNSDQYESDCYVLIVKPNGGDGMFDRVGAGSIDSKYICLEGAGIEARIS
ncbi:hypothetical protein FE257_010577 [Aspergillus nanangensis]|uniref:Heterokaryon incompatibility domain-containing protein n=1 Tax=Aspergillus nanangensis TaxID=2582783 RepID=A0AAD4GT58_ASPNN|nr:hypothetical protein FE257_010577 [Aspergillus nanangensis]